MKYTKNPLSFDEQADQLIERGLKGDRDTIIKRLRDVNYYRLSAYWYPYRNPDNTLSEGASFEIIWDRYVFDRQLRLLVMDAIERVEISIRTRMTNLLTLKADDAFVHLNPNELSERVKAEERERFLNGIRRNTKRSREAFVQHFREKYGDCHDDLPLWMAVEVMTFGDMLTLFKMMDMHSQREVAAIYGVSAKVLKSWLMTLNYVRNLCAHHARLWNREFAVRPTIPAQKRHPDWHDPEISSHRIFATLSLLYFMLKKVAPQSGWADRLECLLNRHPDIPLDDMGFIVDWKRHPLWDASESTKEPK